MSMATYCRGYLNSPLIPGLPPAFALTSAGWKAVVSDSGERARELDGRLVVGGRCLRRRVGLGGTAWDGHSWSNLGGLLEGYPVGFTEWQGGLVASGLLRLPGQQGWSAVAINHGHAWSILGEPLLNDQWSTSAVATFRGELFVAGTSLSAAAGSGSVMRWDGARWPPVPSTPPGTAKCLLSRADGLWVGFAQYGGYGGSSVWRWDGDRWTEMTGLNGEVLVLVEHENDVFAGGSLNASGISTSLARWHGGADPDGRPFISIWTPVPDGPTSAIETMASLGNDLWVGGRTWQAVRQRRSPADENAPAPTSVAGSISRPNPHGNGWSSAAPWRGTATLTPTTPRRGSPPWSTRTPADRSRILVDSIHRVPAGIYFARLGAPASR
jgi:hypothetical protein